LPLDPWFSAARNQDREGIPPEARAHTQFHVKKARACKERLERFIGKPEPAITEAILYPRLIVLAQVEHEHLAAGPENARRLGHHPLGAGGVVQSLR
jgi:hypothetical protein